MQGQRPLGHPHCVVEVDSRRDTPRKVREGNAVVAAGILMDQGNILAHALPQNDPGLLFDALQRPDRQVAAWMWNGDSAALNRVLELDVASLLGDLLPAIGPQSHQKVPTVHS